MQLEVFPSRFSFWSVLCASYATRGTFRTNRHMQTEVFFAKHHMQTEVLQPSYASRGARERTGAGEADSTVDPGDKLSPGS